MEITFRKLNNTEEDYEKLYKWCKNRYIYEWFEQRVLSLDEIKTKYMNKLLNSDQTLFIIQCDGNDIGLVQAYKYDDDIDIPVLNKYKNLYEYDIFIGEEDYLSKGVGHKVIEIVNREIYKAFNADGIVLRPFKRNIRAVNCYEKVGFKVVGEYKGTDTIGNPEVITVLLNKNTNNS
jgi:aminoglycoside 6'-N-acetyltransferase